MPRAKQACEEENSSVEVFRYVQGLGLAGAV